MSTAGFDGKTLAADRKMGERYNVSKLFKLKDGRVAAGVGDYDFVVEIIHWLNNGEKRDELPTLPDKNDGDAQADVIVVDKRGTVFWLTWPFLRPVRLTEKLVAIGSGGDFALGAMAAGKSARDAVAIAARYDPNTGAGIDVVRAVP